MDTSKHKFRIVVRRLPGYGGFEAKVWRNSGQGWLSQDKSITGSKARVEAWVRAQVRLIRRKGFSVEVRRADSQGQMM